MMIKDFHDLDVWRRAHSLASSIFELSDRFPSAYAKDLTSQLRRAALSVPTNLAEGVATAHTRELLQFINIAQRSVSEVQYLLVFARDRHLIQERQYAEFREGYDIVGRMLSGLTRALKRQRSRISAAPHQSLGTNH